jgi:hypothetical protein
MLAADDDGAAGESTADATVSSIGDSTSPSGESGPTVGAGAVDANGGTDASSMDVQQNHFEAEASAACGQLTKCCSHLVVPPPFAVACRLSSYEPDGGDGGTCDSILGVLQDAGLCP